MEARGAMVPSFLVVIFARSERLSMDHSMISCAHSMIREAIASLRAEKAFRCKHIHRVGNRLHQGRREGLVVSGNKSTDIASQGAVLVLDATNLSSDLCQTWLPQEAKLLDCGQIGRNEGLFQFFQRRNEYIQMLEGSLHSVPPKKAQSLRDLPHRGRE